MGANEHTFQPGDNGGRTAGTTTSKSALRKLQRETGFTEVTARKFAEMLESQVQDEKGESISFLEALLEQYRKDLLSKDAVYGRRHVLNQLIQVQKLDEIIFKRNKNEKEFLTFQLYRHLFDEQQAVMMTKRPEVILICGRRSGKSEVLASKMIDVAINASKPRDEGAQGHVLYVAKTFTSARDIIWQRLIDRLEALGVPYTAKHAEQTIIFGNGCEIRVRGADNIDTIEKFRGSAYRLAVIDEVASIKNLKYMVEAILFPALADYRGQIFLAGTPPRVKGTYIESRWNSVSPNIIKFNWALDRNIYLQDYQDILKRVMEERSLKETDPLFQREWLGKWAFDMDALVWRLGPANYYTEPQLREWIQSQPVTDMHFAAGIDIGFEDADAVALILYSERKPEKWLIYEYKAQRTGLDELIKGIQGAMSFVAKSSLVSPVHDKDFIFFIDEGGLGKKISYDMQSRYSLPIQAAYKFDKNFGVEMLAEDIRMGRLKVKADSEFVGECDRTVYKRDDMDNIVREIDEEANPDDHADLAWSIIYAMRNLWSYDPIYEQFQKVTA